jgi:hypothetical protein
MLVDWTNCRTCQFVGGILIFVGYLTSAFVGNLQYLLVTYSVIVGKWLFVTSIIGGTLKSMCVLEPSPCYIQYVSIVSLFRTFKYISLRTSKHIHDFRIHNFAVESQNSRLPLYHGESYLQMCLLYNFIPLGRFNYRKVVVSCVWMYYLPIIDTVNVSVQTIVLLMYWFPIVCSTFEFVFLFIYFRWRSCMCDNVSLCCPGLQL